MTVVRRSLWFGRSSGAGVNRRKSRGRTLLVELGVVLGAANAGAQQVPAPATEKVQGATYYLCGNPWFQRSYGANGVNYRVVPTP